MNLLAVVTPRSIYNSWSISTASFTVIVNPSQYFWFFTQYCWFLDIIWSLLFSLCLFHHANSGPSKILFSTVYSAICNRCKSLIYLSLFHVVLSYFYWIYTSHQLVVFLFVWYHSWLWQTHIDVMFVYCWFLCRWWTQSETICCLIYQLVWIGYQQLLWLPLPLCIHINIWLHKF